MTTDKNLDAALKAASASPPPRPPDDLVARVLADAAAHAPAPVTAPPARPGLWRRLLAPIGGFGGGLALAACAAFGIFIGADFADTLYNIPVVEQVLAALTNASYITSPDETLSLLMAES